MRNKDRERKKSIFQVPWITEASARMRNFSKSIMSYSTELMMETWTGQGNSSALKEVSTDREWACIKLGTCGRQGNLVPPSWVDEELTLLTASSQAWGNVYTPSGSQFSASPARKGHMPTVQQWQNCWEGFRKDKDLFYICWWCWLTRSGLFFFSPHFWAVALCPGDEIAYT
jgi:hypothetical protein